MAVKMVWCLLAFLRTISNNCWVQRNLSASEEGRQASRDMFDEEDKPVPRRHSLCGYYKTRGGQGGGFKLVVHCKDCCAHYFMHNNN